MDDEYDIVKPVRISEVVNDEQLLDFALSHIAEKDTYDVHPTAELIVITYIVSNFSKENKTNFTESDVQEKYSELVADYVVTKLANAGLVDVGFDDNGETLYSLTPEGRNKINDGH